VPHVGIDAPTSAMAKMTTSSARDSAKRRETARTARFATTSTKKKKTTLSGR